jgi:hypothetical protein
MADDELDINPRPKVKVGKRLIILAAVQRRGFLQEEAANDALGDETEEERFDIMAWLQQEGVSDALEPFERELIETNVGLLDEFDEVVCYDGTQRSVALAWYLNLIPEIPPYDEPELPPGYLDLVPSPWDSTATWLDGLTTRTIDELSRARELAEIWYWRSNIELERREATSKNRAPIERTILEAATEAMNVGLISELASGDFPLSHGHITQASADTLDTIDILAEQRLHALNWLSGFGESWSKVPLDL